VNGDFAGLVPVRVAGTGVFDQIMPILAALLIIRAAWGLAQGAFSQLMSAYLSAEKVTAVWQVLEDEQSVFANHNLLTKLQTKLGTQQSGTARFVDARVMMDDDMTLVGAHDLTRVVEARVRAALLNTPEQCLDRVQVNEVEAQAE